MCEIRLLRRLVICRRIYIDGHELNSASYLLLSNRQFALDKSFIVGKQYMA